MEMSSFVSLERNSKSSPEMARSFFSSSSHKALSSASCKHVPCFECIRQLSAPERLPDNWLLLRFQIGEAASPKQRLLRVCEVGL